MAVDTTRSFKFRSQFPKYINKKLNNSLTLRLQLSFTRQKLRPPVSAMFVLIHTSTLPAHCMTRKKERTKEVRTKSWLGSCRIGGRQPKNDAVKESTLLDLPGRQSLLTHYTEHSSSWKPHICSASQEFPLILPYMKFHCHVHKCPCLVSVVSKINPVFVIQSHFFKILFKITLQTTPVLSGLFSLICSMCSYLLCQHWIQLSPRLQPTTDRSHSHPCK
jgi:hypothetical protein